jgi:hypothetical protein
MTEKQMFPLSAELKEALGKYASEHDESVASVIRRAICKELGLPVETVSTSGRRKYASVEERQAAQKARNAEKAALVKLLLAEHNAKAK